MEIILANSVTLVFLLSFIFIRWKKNQTFLEPGIIFSINLALLYPIRAITLYVYGYEAGPSYEEITYVDNIETASWIALIGCIGYVVGYQFVMRKERLAILKKMPDQNYKKSELSTISVLFAFALVGIVYKIVTNDYISYLRAEDQNAGLAQMAALLTGLQWPAFIGSWILWFGGCRKKAFLILFAVIVLTVVPYQFIQGSKTFLSLLLVSIVISNYWINGRLPRASVFVGIILVSTFVFPYVYNFREYINSTHGKIPEIAKLSIKDLREMASAAPEADQNKVTGFMGISARYAGIDELYNLQEMVPSILDYKYGLDYTASLVNLIPRAIWPSKPIYSRGAVYGASLGTTTSITPFPIGEAYWDMGKYGVFLMMFIWGGFLAGIVKGYDYFYKKNNKSQLILFYFLYQIYWISGGETSMPMVLSGLFQQIILIWLVSKVISETQKFAKRISKKNNQNYYK